MNLKSLLSWRPAFWLRLVALFASLHGDFETAHRKTCEWNCMITAKRRAQAIADDDAAQAELRRCDASIRAFDQDEKRARVALAVRGAR